MDARSTVLRGLLARPGILAGPTVFDCLSARIAEQSGFEFLFSSGFGISATRLGLPDRGYLTATEMIDAVRSIAGAVTVPLIADMDTGYGNARNVSRTVCSAIQAGVAGIILEDQVWPKRCGHMEGKQVVSMEEHVEKIEAAVEAGAESGLVIVARTDALAVNGLDDALERARAYRDAGADVLFVEAPQTIEELQGVARAFPGTHLMANMIPGGRTPCMAAQELEELGFKLVALALSGLFASADALRRTYGHLAETGSVQGPSQGVDFQEFQKIVAVAK